SRDTPAASLINPPPGPVLRRPNLFSASPHLPDKGRFMGRFFDWLFAKHTCECGAVYKVSVIRSPSPDTDDACCEACGLMNSWQHSTRYRSYDLMSQSPLS